MQTPRFYTPSALDAHSETALDEKASAHIARVLRMRVGDKLTLFDGSGGEYPAQIVAIGKKAVQVSVGALLPREVESPLSIHLGVGMSRGDRMDWIVQKATELGVTSITPLITERCGLKLKGERQDKKLRHWQGVAISACEQCGRNRIPQIAAPKTLADELSQTKADTKLVLHHRASTLEAATETPSSIALLIGPEGGLSEQEIAQAQQQGYQAITLGPRVLRTETAPLAALTIVQSMWGDMALTTDTR